MHYRPHVDTDDCTHSGDDHRPDFGALILLLCWRLRQARELLLLGINRGVHS